DTFVSAPSALRVAGSDDKCPEDSDNPNGKTASWGSDPRAQARAEPRNRAHTQESPGILGSVARMPRCDSSPQKSSPAPAPVWRSSRAPVHAEPVLGARAPL